jgi:tetratricopeptide (TPR) repeat protein
VPLGVRGIALGLGLVLLPWGVSTAARRAKRTASDSVVTAAAHVTGVERELVVVLPVAPGLPATAQPLPAGLGIEIEIATEAAALAGPLDDLGPPWIVTSQAREGGTRIRITHPSPSVVFTTQRKPEGLLVSLGVANEETRLRELGAMIRRPLPTPSDLGPELEVWHEAERALAEADLPEAKRLWERLAEVPRIADVAALRIAELYIVSGHVGEALSQLRGVARNHPRTAGAALARLDILHLETLTGVATSSLEQIDVAATVANAGELAGLVALRTAMVLHAMDLDSAALVRLPDPDAVAGPWREVALDLRRDLLALALLGPALRGDPRGTVIQWNRWKDSLDEAAGREQLVDLVSASHEALGLFDEALVLLQERLRTISRPADEAELIGRMIHAYRMLGDIERAAYAIEFQSMTHPSAPGLVPEIAAHAISRAARDGLGPARVWLGSVRSRAGSPVEARALEAIDAELVLAWGTPAQIVQRLSPNADGEPTPLMQPHSNDPITATRHARALAVALVRTGRHAAAAPALRELAGRTADPAERDRLSYYLALAEAGLGNADDARTIHRHVASHGTFYSRLSTLRLQEERLAKAVSALESATGSAP